LISFKIKNLFVTRHADYDAERRIDYSKKE
jgi:hypothetical protein